MDDQELTDEQREELLISEQLATKVEDQIKSAIAALKRDPPDFDAARKAVETALDRFENYQYGYAEPGGAKLKELLQSALKAIEEKDAKAALTALEKASKARTKQASIKKPPTSDISDTSPTEARITLAGQVRTTQAGGYEVVLMDPGEGNGWTWPSTVLARDYAIFDGTTSFLDHERRSVQADRPGGRKTEDICGIVTSPRWDDQAKAILATWSPRRPKGQLALAIIEDFLADKVAGHATTNVGLSVDVSFTHKDKTVTRLAKAHSADVVYNPARGGRFVRALLAQQEPPQEVPMTEQLAERTAQAEEMWKWQAQALLDAMLTKSGLHPVSAERIRAQFADATILPMTEVEEAIATEREYLGKVIEDKVIEGVGKREDQPPQVVRLGGDVIRATPTSDPMDRIRLALVRWFGGDLPDGIKAADVPRVDIGQLYADLTGDINIVGRWDIPGATERVGLANITDTTFNNVVADSMNVVILQQWDVAAAIGYDWWRKIVHEQDFDSVFEVEWTTIGGFGNLDKINPGQAIPELSISDLDTAEDTGNWEMAGGMISIPIQTFDKAAKRGGFKSLPKKLGVAAIRTLSADVANIFTSNAGVGPTLADSVALFNLASHNNLRTTAFSVAAWEEVIQDQWKQTEQNSSKYLAIRPAYIVVPIELESLGKRVVGGELRQGIADNDIVPTGYGLSQDRVIPCPEFTDATDWATITEPRLHPSIGVGYRYGRKPQVIAEPGGQASYGMFTRNVLRWKAQWLYVVSVITHRGLQKRNVAG